VSIEHGLFLNLNSLKVVKIAYTNPFRNACAEEAPVA